MRCCGGRVVEVVVAVPFVIAWLVAVVVTWRLSQVKTKQINQPRVVFASEQGEVGHTGSNIKLEVNNIESFSKEKKEKAKDDKKTYLWLRHICISSPDVWCGSDGHLLLSNGS